MNLFDRFADRLIERAKRTPYTHLANAAGDVYMERYWLIPFPGAEGGDAVRLGWFGRWLQRRGIAARVHCIRRSDRGRHPHGHPWTFISLVLKGRYLELRFDARGNYIRNVHRSTGGIALRRPNDYHYVKLPREEPAWTLFITGPKRQTWGFIVDGEFVRHTQYEGEP